MRTNSLLPTVQIRLQEEAKVKYGRDLQSSFTSAADDGGFSSMKLPSWIGKASEDLARFDCLSLNCSILCHGLTPQIHCGTAVLQGCGSGAEDSRLCRQRVPRRNAAQPDQERHTHEQLRPGDPAHGEREEHPLGVRNQEVSSQSTQ